MHLLACPSTFTGGVAQYAPAGAPPSLTPTPTTIEPRQRQIRTHKVAKGLTDVCAFCAYNTQLKLRLEIQKR